MIPRLFIDLPLAGEQCIPLPEGMVNYLLNTMRRKPGDGVILFCGGHEEWEAVLERHEGVLHARLLKERPVARESSLEIHLVQGMPKGPAMDLSLRMATELGIARFLPLVCKRSLIRPREDREEHKIGRLSRIAAEAAEQCGRTRVPEILPPLAWRELPAQLPREGLRLLFWEGESASVGQVLRESPPFDRVVLLLGPEGGLEKEEVAWARQEMGFSVVSLGPRILRAETAVAAAVAVVQFAAGDGGT